jgi:hypothetical protein
MLHFTCVAGVSDAAPLTQAVVLVASLHRMLRVICVAGVGDAAVL